MSYTNYKKKKFEGLFSDIIRQCVMSIIRHQSVRMYSVQNILVFF